MRRRLSVIFCSPVEDLYSAPVVLASARSGRDAASEAIGLDTARVASLPCIQVHTLEHIKAGATTRAIPQLLRHYGLYERAIALRCLDPEPKRRRAARHLGRLGDHHCCTEARNCDCGCDRGFVLEAEAGRANARWSLSLICVGCALKTA